MLNIYLSMLDSPEEIVTKIFFFVFKYMRAKLLPNIFRFKQDGNITKYIETF